MKLKISKKQLRQVGKKVGGVAKVVGKKLIDLGLTRAGTVAGEAAGSYLLGPEAGPESGAVGGLIGHETAGAINKSF